MNSTNAMADAVKTVEDAITATKQSVDELVQTAQAAAVKNCEQALAARRSTRR